MRPPQFPSAELVGGRLSNIHQYPAAYLLYNMHGNRVTVLVFDPKIRGKTDRVVFKFKKPR